MIIDKFRKVFKLYKDARRKKKNLRKQKNMEMYGKEVCENISFYLSEAGIEHFYFYGTMLGFIREKNFILHDTDIDLCVVENDFFSWEKLEESILKMGGGAKIRQFKIDGKITEQTYKINGINVDFFLCSLNKIKNKMEIFSYYQDKNIKYENERYYSVALNTVSIISDIVDVDTKIGKMRVPKNYAILLEELYGINWRIPDASFKDNTSPSWSKVTDKLGIVEKFYK